MIPPLKAVRKILWGNVYLHGKKIPVVQRNYPYDTTPSITIENSGGSSFHDRYITNINYPLKNNHPQFNEQKPYKKQPQQVLREEYSTTINIHIWANTEDEREGLNTQVLKLFHQAQSDHYMFCNRYQDGMCCYLQKPCQAILDTKTNRGVKEQCPKPFLYGYKNIFTTYNLIRSSFHVEPAFNLDDYGKKPPVLRSIMKLETGYYIDHIIGGHIDNNINNQINLK